MGVVLMDLLGHARREEIEIGIGTAAAESAFRDRVQADYGPARGLFMMEPDTAYDIFDTYLSRPDKRSLFQRLVMLWMNLGSVPFWRPKPEELGVHLMLYDDFAIAMMRLKYLRDPEPIPKTLEGQAEYYWRVYATPASKASPEKYLKAWEAHDCAEAVEYGLSQADWHVRTWAKVEELLQPKGKRGGIGRES